MGTNIEPLTLVIRLLSYSFDNHTVSNLRAWQALSTVEPTDLLTVDSGESVAIEGTLTVETPVDDADLLAPESEQAIGGFLWRTGDTDDQVTPDDAMWEHQQWMTFASGIEWGELAISTANHTVRLDPSWLRTVSESTPLSGLSINPIEYSSSKTYLWNAPRLYCRARTIQSGVGQLTDGPYEFDDRVNPDWYLFEARLLQDGMSLSVYGELRRSENELVVGGSDDQPLFITDQGFESQRQWLKRRVLKTGVLVLAVCVITVGIFLEVYWPLLIATVACVLRVFYHRGTYIIQWAKYR